MNDIENGQVLSLKIRYNNIGTIANIKHPYLVVDVNEELGIIEIAQLDSLEGKEYKAALRSNKSIFNDEPVETVIDKDSYVQLDNILKVENFDGLQQFRRQLDKLSSTKLNAVLMAYNKYHENYEIDENKNVYMDKIEIQNLNQ